ncbi:hypothetical protein [Paraburkholderia sp. BR10882]|uniref:hypothetical protein n=1 Tax=unclassified Paraburkholderia TaxID=2615204 RepID=UPI0034CEA690
MASLLSLLGLDNSSGLPFKLTDDEQQQLAQQAQGTPTSGVSALMGVTGQDSTSQQAQPIQAATQQSLLSQVAQGDSNDAKGSDANPSYATKANVDQSDTDSESNNDATAAPTNSDNPSTSTVADVDTPSNATPAANTDTSAGAQPSFLSKLMTEMRSNPTLGEALMNAGFGMMANSRYGTPGLAAVGMGAQTGLQTYNALKQQQIQNQIAQLNAQREIQTANVNNQQTIANTQQTQLANASKRSLMAYAAQAGTNFTIPGAIAAGALPQDAISAFQGLHPNLNVQTDDAGNVYGINPQTGQRINLGSATKIVNTPAGNTTTAYNGTGSGGQITPQVVQQGGLAPEQVNQNVQKYNTAQQAAVTKSQQAGQFLNQLQTADAMNGSGAGVIGAGMRTVESKLGMNDPNSILRQQFASTNIQQILSGLPSGSRMDQNFLKLAENTVANPDTATPENMLRTTALLKSKADYDSIDSEARSAYVAANGGMETPLKKATTVTVNGNSWQLPAGTTIQQLSDAATKKFVDWDPALINPKWADGKSQAQINQAQAFANDPKQRDKLRAAGVLLPSNMRNGG